MKKRNILVALVGVMITGLIVFAAVFLINLGSGRDFEANLAQNRNYNSYGAESESESDIYEGNEGIADQDQDQDFDLDYDYNYNYGYDEVVRINENTKIVYEYYNAQTQAFEIAKDYAAELLFGMTRQETEIFFADWDVLAFSQDEVVLRQRDDLAQRRYIIGAHNGYIAVFYDNEQMGLKELTNRPISALLPEEQERLKEGIKVVGVEELMRALEDFSS